MAGLRLPDELWRQILEFGIRSSKFTYKDLCSLSISCKALHRLSDDDSLWLHLHSSDFPATPHLQNPSTANHRRSTPPSAKSAYRIRFEKEKERILAAHRRAVFRKESEIMERERKIRETQRRLLQETERMKEASKDLSNLHKVRNASGSGSLRLTIYSLGRTKSSGNARIMQATVALNVWQPEVVRGWQKQIVEQNSVSVDSRVHSLEMELRLCKQQISGLNKAYKNEKQLLKNAMEELESMKYHPLRDYRSTAIENKESNKIRKKLKI